MSEPKHSATLHVSTNVLFLEIGVQNSYLMLCFLVGNSMGTITLLVFPCAYAHCNINSLWFIGPWLPWQVGLCSRSW